MKGNYLNKLHRYVGICLTPFLVIQTLSGLLLDFGLFRRGASGPGGEEAQQVRSALDALLVKLHFGPGVVNDGYHILLGIAILWMTVSGWMLYLRIRRVRKKSVTVAAPGAAP
jgi:uncharacterized iron-regulated membrane protein